MTVSVPAPAGRVGPARLFDYWRIVFLRTWKGSVISSFVSPLLYVVAMGVVLGGFIHAGPAKLGGATTYLAFVAPGLVAAQTMQAVFGEVTYPVMGMIKWHKSYFGMIASPLRVVDVMAAHLGFVVFRIAITAAVFLAVLSAFGVFTSPVGVVGAFFVQLLVGLAFATPVYAISAGLKDETAFGLIFRLGMIPLFLFSGAFFPLSNLPDWLATLAKFTPLWHGVDLTRMLTLGDVSAGWALIHLAYLAALSALGFWWGLRRLTRRMIT
ncbi:MAG TPA: ABC transporter permease [Nocardioidaceae bacterium]|nr:ABC transporter permease [Nocardioidaceae bacterium]